MLSRDPNHNPFALTLGELKEILDSLCGGQAVCEHDRSDRGE